MLTSKEMAALAVKTLDSKQARDIKVLEVKDITVLSEYFIICTATSTAHVKTLSDELAMVMSDNGEPPLRVEGLRSGGWILVDFGCVIVHIFLDETRKFYNLERLWADAPVLDEDSFINGK